MIAAPIRSDRDRALDLTDDDVDVELEVEAELDAEPMIGMALAPFVDDLALSLADADTDWALSGAAERCIARFAAAEADVASAELGGLGRVSGTRCPRLGGVLHGRLAPGSAAADALVLGVEQTVRGGYHVAASTHQVAGVPIRHGGADELWSAFVPASYRVPRSVAATAWEVCRFDRYWVSLLHELGLEREARRLGLGRPSALSRSIRGLGTVGVALAVSERGGRPQRHAVDRQPRRDRARPMRTPPVPRRLRVVD